jgi:hypothetical protein
MGWRMVRAIEACIRPGAEHPMPGGRQSPHCPQHRRGQLSRAVRDHDAGRARPRWDAGRAPVGRTRLCRKTPACHRLRRNGCSALLPTGSGHRHSFTTGSAFRVTDQPPMQGALLTTNWRGCEGAVAMIATTISVACFSDRKIGMCLGVPVGGSTSCIEEKDARSHRNGVSARKPGDRYRKMLRKRVERE